MSYARRTNDDQLVRNDRRVASRAPTDSTSSSFDPDNPGKIFDRPAVEIPTRHFAESRCCAPSAPVPQTERNSWIVARLWNYGVSKNAGRDRGRQKERDRGRERERERERERQARKKGGARREREPVGRTWYRNTGKRIPVVASTAKTESTRWKRKIPYLATEQRRIAVGELGGPRSPRLVAAPTIDEYVTEPVSRATYRVQRVYRARCKFTGRLANSTERRKRAPVDSN